MLSFNKKYTEAEVLECIRKDDVLPCSALSWFHGKSIGLLYSICAKYRFSKEQLEDIYAEAFSNFVKQYRNPDKVVEKNLGAYLGACIANQAKQALKSEIKEKNIQAVADAIGAIALTISKDGKSGVNIEDVVQIAKNHPYWEYFALYHIDDMTQESVAAKIGTFESRFKVAAKIDKFIEDIKAYVKWLNSL